MTRERALGPRGAFDGSRDKDAQLRNLIAGYGNSMTSQRHQGAHRSAIRGDHDGSGSPVPRPLSLVSERAGHPSPFMIIYLNLLFRFIRDFPAPGGKRFPIWRNADPEDFDFVADTEAELERLPALCAGLSRILWWKNITLLTANLLRSPASRRPRSCCSSHGSKRLEGSEPFAACRTALAE